MTKIFFEFGAALGLCAVLGACGAAGNNPISGGEIGSDNPDASDTSGNGVYADGDLLVLNNARYDATTDKLFLNNLPFDGPEGQYDRVAGVTVGGSGAAVYESIVTPTTGQRKYYALFQRSASDSVQTIAVSTDDYIDSGFGGVTAQRISGSGSLPASGEFLYLGTYAATRVVRDEGAGPGVGELQFVEADMLLEVDILDFDVTGAIEGRVGDRRIYDLAGTQVGTNSGITLFTSSIDPDTQLINSGTATGFVIDPVTGARSGEQSGTWEGLFAGPNGTEVGGIVVLTGSDGDLSIRETGGFIAVQQ